MKKTIIVSLCVCASFMFAVDTTSPEKKYANATEAQLSEALNTLASNAIADGQAIKDRQRIVEVAWTNPEITSPEIETIRKKISELESELMKARKELREAVNQLPEIKSQREGIEKEIQKRADDMAELAYVRQRLQTLRTKGK